MGGAMNGVTFYVPLDLATTPLDGECLVNRWWAVHPEKGVAFYAHAGLRRVDHDEHRPAPQCNESEYTCRALTPRTHPDCDVVFIPVFFVSQAVKVARELARAERGVAP
jgi:hypothetical protein